MLTDGKIKADSWVFEITSQTREKEFLLSELAGKISPLVHSGNYRSYYTESFEVYGRKFVFRVYFENGVIVSVSLSPSSNKISWDNIESKGLQKEKIENERWLIDNFGVVPPSNFEWGSIELTLDKKGGAANIIIRYKKSGKD